MLLSEAVEDYLQYARHEKGLTQMTLLHYKTGLNAFLRWCGSNGYPTPSLADLTTPLLRRYMYSLGARNLRPRSVHTAFHPIRSLCVFLLDQGGIQTNPAEGIKLPKKDAARRETVSDEEIRRLMEACERQRTPRQISLARAVLGVLVFGGLRRAEVCDLEKDDVDVVAGSILVRSGKGNKSRKIYVCEDCVNGLREWLAVREKDCRHDYLFALDRNRRVHYDGIASLLETVKSTAGMRDHENIKPHSLRHACATRLLRNGASIKDISVFLGHAQLATTAIYLHSDEQQLRDIAALGALKPPKPAPSSIPPTSPTTKRSGRWREDRRDRH